MQKTVRASRSSGVRLSTGHLKTHASVRRHGVLISSTFSSTLSPDWTLLSSRWTFLLLDWTLTPRPPMTETHRQFSMMSVCSRCHFLWRQEEGITYCLWWSLYRPTTSLLMRLSLLRLRRLSRVCLRSRLRLRLLSRLRFLS